MGRMTTRSGGLAFALTALLSLGVASAQDDPAQKPTFVPAVDAAKSIADATHLAAKKNRRVLVLWGRGNNGGGGLVCARRLHAWRARVRILTTHPAEAYLGIPEHQLDIADRMGIPITQLSTPTVLGDVDLVIDAIIGYGLTGAPKEEAARLIDLANDFGAPILSLDAPSGINVTDGRALGVAIRADATLTLALPKVGLQKDGAKDFVGELYVGDLGVPPELYAGSGLAYGVDPIFAKEEIIRL